MSDSSNRHRRKTDMSAAVPAKRSQAGSILTKHGVHKGRRARVATRITTSTVISDQQWKAAFAGSENILARLADEALADFGAGRTKPLDPDHL